jgi:hypothetical protein
MPKGLCKYCGSDEIEVNFDWYGGNIKSEKDVKVKSWCSNCNRYLSDGYLGENDGQSKRRD